MALVGPRREDDRRPVLAHDLDDLQLLAARGAEASVAEVELLAKRRAEDARGRRGLALARARRAARPHLAAGEVDDADAEAALHEVDDCAAARQLDVVGVGVEEEGVDGGHEFLVLSC